MIDLKHLQDIKRDIQSGKFYKKEDLKVFLIDIIDLIEEKLKENMGIKK